MNLFYEKAFWAFMALVGALVMVIYNLFQSKIELKIKEEIKGEIEPLRNDMDKIKIDVHKIKNNNAQGELALETLKKNESLEDEIKKLRQRLYETK